jgi:hypothetical protein
MFEKKLARDRPVQENHIWNFSTQQGRERILFQRLWSSLGPLERFEAHNLS